MVGAWTRPFIGVNGRAEVDRALKAIEGAGVSVEAGPCPGHGLLLMGGAAGEVIEYLLERGRESGGNTLVVILPGADASAKTMSGLLGAGASDVIEWTPAVHPVECIRERLARWEAVDALLESPGVKNLMVGRCPIWLAQLRRIAEIACFTDLPVLITGETGTGKELAARLIHHLDQRPQKTGITVVDCTVIPQGLSSSELFGHERGAFTGAISTRMGAFATADGGTLFLDEVGELPLNLQAELLRVIQEGTYKRVGSDAWRQTRFRLVCATNRDLACEMAHGRFRGDLYYRIAHCTFRLPPLRERKEDILPLASHFLAESLKTPNPPGFTQFVSDYLERREYPGNIRDLKLLIGRMASRHVGPGPLTPGDIPEEEREGEPGKTSGPNGNDPLKNAVGLALGEGMGLEEISAAARETAVRIALEREGGNLQKAAVRLKVTDRALQKRKAAAQAGGQTPGGRNGGSAGADSTQ